MPEFAILLFNPAPADPMAAPPDEIEAHGQYAEEVEKLGGKVDFAKAQALQASTTAKSVRGDSVSDGPFIDSDQVLFGYFVLEARDIDHAVEIARKNPATWRGGAEVRPIFAPPEE